MTTISRNLRPRSAMKAVAFGLTLALPGCAGAHLHDAGNHELAKTAQADFKALSVSTSLDAERKLSDEMLKSELEAARGYLLAQRDQALLEVLDPSLDRSASCVAGGATPCPGTWSAFRASRLDKGGIALVDVHAKAFRPLADEIAEWRLEARNLRREDSAYRVHFSDKPGAPEPMCPASAALVTWIDKQGADAATNQGLVYRQACDRYLQKEEALIKATSSGSVGTVLAQIKAAEKEEAGKKSELEAKLKLLKDALAAYNAAKPTSRAQAEEIGKKLKINDTFEELTALEPFGKLSAVTELLDNVNAVIDSSVKGELTTDKPVPWSIAEIVTESALALDQIRGEGALPALLLESERLRIDAEAARVAVERHELEIGILQARRLAMVAELEALGDAVVALDEAAKLDLHGKELSGAAPPAAPPPAAPGKRRGKLESAAPAGAAPLPCLTDTALIHESLAQSSGLCRMQLSRALIQYANSWTLGRMPQNQARWRLVGVTHDRALDLSATAMRHWENILSVPIAEIVKYEATGTTPEAAAQLVFQILQTAGIGVTAAGVLAK